MTSNLPFSEQYARAGLHWADLDAAATMLEETKSAVLAQMMTAQGDVSVARAEMLTKASPQWKDHIERMVKARTAANKAKIQMEYLRMRFWESQSQQATERVQAKI